MPDFSARLFVGDFARTIKGAAFWGKVIGTHDNDGHRPGVTLEAVAPGFEGTRHVYPRGQVERCAPDGSDL